MARQPTSPRPPAEGMPAWVHALGRHHLLTRHVRPLAGWLLLVIMAGITWRVVRYLMDFPVWGDEGFVVMNVVRRDFHSAWKVPLEYIQIVDIGFLWIELATTRLLGIGTYAMRLPCLVMSVAALLGLWRFSRQALGRAETLLAVAVLATSYYSVRHGGEVKAYVFDLAFAVAILWATWAVRTRPDRLGRWATLAGLCAVGVWISLPAIFLAAASGVFLAGFLLAVRRRWRYAAHLSIFAVATLGSFAVVYFSFLAEIHSTVGELYVERMPTWQNAFPPMDRPWQLPWWLLEVHAGNMMAYPFGGKHFGSLASLLLAIGGGVRLWRTGRKDLLALLLLPFVVTLLAAAIKKYPYGTSARIAQHLAPSIVMLVGVGLVGVIRAVTIRRLVPEGVRLTAGVLAVAAVACAVVDVAYPYKVISNVHTRQAARALAERTGPRDRWMMANSLALVPHAPVMTGPNAVCFRYYTHLYLSDLYEEGRIVWGPRPRAIRPAEGRTWLVYFTQPQMEPVQGRRRQWEAMLHVARQRLGPEREHLSFPLHEPDYHYAGSSVEAYLFDAR